MLILVYSNFNRKRKDLVNHKKPQKTADVGWRPILIIAAVGLLPFLFMLVPAQPKGPGRPDGGADENLISLKERYFREKARNKSSWWLEKVPHPSESARIHAIITNRVANIQDIISRYRSLSPLTEEIGRHFEKFYVTLALDERRSATVMTDEERKEQIGKAPELTFIARETAPRMGTPLSLYWRSDWGMMMNAVDHPPVAFAGFLFHELGHGLLHPIRADTAYHDPQSREYILEECRMHELETLVDDQASDGKFSAAISRFLAKTRRSASAPEALRNIDMALVRELDQAFGATDAGIETASLLFAEYMMAIGLRHIKEHHGGDEEKIALFRWTQDILQ
ncbi:MAG: hypothetical protein QOG91_360 [Candidatus Parcubacteria bacterium]|jgi:hypothetical protein|nr:hypothetical protein [Candidatus Parcubacteria bacterium]